MEWFVWIPSLIVWEIDFEEEYDEDEYEYELCFCFDDLYSVYTLTGVGKDGWWDSLSG